MQRETGKSELRSPGLSTGPRIAIVGTGALGSTLLARLADRDVSSVLLIDPDRLESRNIALSPLFQQAMQCRALASAEAPLEVLPDKAELLADHVTQTYGIPAHAVVAEIADIGWQDLLDVDELYCCTDSALSRVETTFIARALGKRMLDGGVFGDGIHGGRVSDFSPSPEAACYLCGMSEDSRAAVLGYAASASLGCRVPEDAPSMTGTLRMLSGVADLLAGSLAPTPQVQATESRSVRIWGGDRTIETSQLHFDKVALTRSATCPWHDGLPSKLEPLPWDQPLGASIRALDHGSRTLELQFAWPICTEAACAACGARSQPFLRVASVRRRAVCAKCGARSLEPMRAVHRIRADDPLSERSPRQLGQPPRHLYWMHHTAGRNSSCEGAT